MRIATIVRMVVSSLHRYKMLLIVLAVTVFMIVAFLANLMRSDVSPVELLERKNISAPDMTSVIEIVFDNGNTNAYYDWTVVETEHGKTFIETNSFNQFGNEYELLLASLKVDPADESYTVPDYLTLTLRVPNDEKGVDVITYIDLAADGIIDSAYLNDVEVVGGGLFSAQDQYATELYASRRYMLDGVSI